MRRVYLRGAFILALIMAANVLLALVSWALIASPAVAQDGGQPVEGTRYDSYPHPSSPGALAYKLADRWDRTDLTFYFHNCPSTVNCNAAWDAVRAGFQEWARLSLLTFTEVDNPRQADIELAWSSQGPELGYMGDVLAYATLPRDGGDVFFDDSEPWGIFDGTEFDLFLVATHEIGHALGLDHSSIPNALMYPVINRLTTGITQDDAAAIQALYGLPQPSRPPQPVPQQPGSAEQVSGEISDWNPYEMWEFDAYAGETITVTMQTTSGDLIPYVGILTNDEQTVLAENGAGDNDYAVQVTYTFEQDGTYVVVATRRGVDEGYTSGTYSLSLAWSEAAAPPSLPPAQQVPVGDTVVLVDLRSYTPVDLCEAYIVPAGSGQGQNLLTDRMTNGNSRSFELPAGVYDVQVVGCNGMVLEERGVQVSQDLAIEVYDDDINVYVYGA